MTITVTFPKIDIRAVGAGVAVASAITVATLVAFRVANAVSTSGISCKSNLNLLFYLPILASWVAGGRRAASRRPDAPFSHALLAALGAFVVLAVVRLVAGALVDAGRECEPGPAEYLFNAMVATSAGILGGLLALHRRDPLVPPTGFDHRPRRRDTT